MRYFTASSLLSKLEDIVTLPAASAADAAATAATAAEPFSSTYTYSSFHSSQIGVNHLHHYHYPNRQKRQSTTTTGNCQQRTLASLQKSHSSETLQNSHWKIKKSSLSIRNKNHNSALPKQEHLCDRIKFHFPKKKRPSSDLTGFSKATFPSRTKPNRSEKRHPQSPVALSSWNSCFGSPTPSAAGNSSNTLDVSSSHTQDAPPSFSSLLHVPNAPRGGSQIHAMLSILPRASNPELLLNVEDLFIENDKTFILSSRNG